MLRPQGRELPPEKLLLKAGPAARPPRSRPPPPKPTAPATAVAGNTSQPTPLTSNIAPLLFTPNSRSFLDLISRGTHGSPAEREAFGVLRERSGPRLMPRLALGQPSR
jgi:hypothetical protein